MKIRIERNYPGKELETIPGEYDFFPIEIEVPEPDAPLLIEWLEVEKEN